MSGLDLPSTSIKYKFFGGKEDVHVGVGWAHFFSSLATFNNSLTAWPSAAYRRLQLSFKCAWLAILCTCTKNKNKEHESRDIAHDMPCGEKVARVDISHCSLHKPVLLVL